MTWVEKRLASRQVSQITYLRAVLIYVYAKKFLAALAAGLQVSVK